MCPKIFSHHGFRSIGIHNRKLYSKIQKYTAVNLPWLELGAAFFKKEFTEIQNINIIPKHLIPQSVPPGLKQAFTHDHLRFTERDSCARISRLILKRFPLTIECNYLAFTFLISYSRETGFPLKLVLKFYIILVRKDARLQEIGLQGRVKRNMGYSQLSNWLVSLKLPINDTYICVWQFLILEIV